MSVGKDHCFLAVYIKLVWNDRDNLIQYSLLRTIVGSTQLARFPMVEKHGVYPVLELKYENPLTGRKMEKCEV